jgi:hypothetical protein
MHLPYRYNLDTLASLGARGFTDPERLVITQADIGIHLLDKKHLIIETTRAFQNGFMEKLEDLEVLKNEQLVSKRVRQHRKKLFYMQPAAVAKNVLFVDYAILNLANTASYDNPAAPLPVIPEVLHVDNYDRWKVQQEIAKNRYRQRVEEMRRRAERRRRLNTPDEANPAWKKLSRLVQRMPALYACKASPVNVGRSRNYISEKQGYLIYTHVIRSYIFGGVNVRRCQWGKIQEAVQVIESHRNSDDYIPATFFEWRNIDTLEKLEDVATGPDREQYFSTALWSA